jgi:hypothetical protein
MHCNYIEASENLQKCIHLFGVCTQYSLTRHVIDLLSIQWNEICWNKHIWRVTYPIESDFNQYSTFYF